jgi:hypothetical protein
MKLKFGDRARFPARVTASGLCSLGELLPTPYSLLPIPYSLFLERNVVVGDFGGLGNVVLTSWRALVEAGR